MMMMKRQHSTDSTLTYLIKVPKYYKGISLHIPIEEKDFDRFIAR